MKLVRYIDVYIVDVQYPKTPSRWQQFVNIQTDEVVEQSFLVGWSIHKTFIDTFGRMCMTFKNPQ